MSERRGRRLGGHLDGAVWLLVILLALFVTSAVVTAPAAHAQEAAREESLGDGLYPPAVYPTDASDGVFPIGRYDIGCANDGLIGDVGCFTVGTATNLIFTLGKQLVGLAIWLLEMATGFTLEDTLTDTATGIADLLDRRVLGPIGIAHLGLVISALYMGWQFLRGRIGLGAGEFALTLIILAVLIYVTAGPGFGGAVTTTTRAAGGISTEILALASGSDPDADPAANTKTALVAGFIRDPYDTLNWGHPLTDTRCGDARNQALETGPHGFDDHPRDLMTATGCQAEAEFNDHATVTRLVASLLYFLVAVAALALLVVTAFTLVVAKGMAIFLIALLPVALYAGLFPGGGRSLLWHWVSALLRVIALVIAMGIFLALLVAGLGGLLALPGGLWERFLLVVFFMAVMWVGRRQLIDMSSRFADSTLQRLQGARLGGGHGAAWIRPYQAGGISGFGVAHTTRETLAELPRRNQTPLTPAGARWLRRRTP